MIEHFVFSPVRYRETRLSQGSTHRLLAFAMGPVRITGGKFRYSQFPDIGLIPAVVKELIVKNKVFRKINETAPLGFRGKKVVITLECS